MCIFYIIVSYLVLRIALVIFATNKVMKIDFKNRLETKLRAQASLGPIYKEFPHLRNDITDLIHYKKCKYIVFIDAEGELDWETTDKMDSELKDRAESFHKILADVDILANQAGVCYFSPEIKRAFMWHLGRAVVLVLEGQDVLARKMVIFASRFSYARLLESARNWQQNFSFMIYLIVLIMFIFFAAFGEYFNAEVKTVINTVFFGCTGVVLSAIRNLGKLRYIGGPGKYMHFLQVLSRYVAGSIGAWLLTMLFQSGIVLQNLSSSENEGIMLAIIGVVGGFSERMVPSLLEKFTVEGEISNEEGGSASGESRRFRQDR